MLVDIDWTPPRKTLTGFGWAGLFMLPAIGALIWWRGGFLFWSFPDSAQTVFFVLLGLGVFGALCSLLEPRGNLPLYWLLLAVGIPIAFVLNFVIFGLLFYGMITPLGLFFHLIGRDALQRKLDPEAETYWQDHEAPRDVSRYFKQF